jgi:glutaminyl-peptide cyclotransferase
MFFRNRFFIFLPGLLIALIFSDVHAGVPEFDSKSAFAYLQKQCAFGPRHPGSKGHRDCLNYLVREFENSADAATRQPFLFSDPKNQQTHTLTNLIASFGSSPKRILLCAHWDTRPWADSDPNPKNWNKPIMGANDGASGVAVLLEIARVLKNNPPPVGVDIVLFDGEDSGLQGQNQTWCQGSRFFAESKHLTHLPIYGILLDFVGDKDLHFPVEVNSYRFAPEIVDKVWGKASELGLSAFDHSPGYEMIDDHLELLKVGIPAIDIIDFDYPYYHTLQDTEDKCSPESLGTVGTLLLHLIYEE